MVSSGLGTAGPVGESRRLSDIPYVEIEESLPVRARKASEVHHLGIDDEGAEVEEINRKLVLLEAKESSLKRFGGKRNLNSGRKQLSMEVKRVLREQSEAHEGGTRHAEELRVALELRTNQMNLVLSREAALVEKLRRRVKDLEGEVVHLREESEAARKLVEGVKQELHRQVSEAERAERARQYQMLHTVGNMAKAYTKEQAVERLNEVQLWTQQQMESVVDAGSESAVTARNDTFVLQIQLRHAREHVATLGETVREKDDTIAALQNRTTRYRTQLQLVRESLAPLRKELVALRAQALTLADDFRIDFPDPFVAMQKALAEHVALCCPPKLESKLETNNVDHVQALLAVCQGITNQLHTALDGYPEVEGNERVYASALSQRENPDKTWKKMEKIVQKLENEVLRAIHAAISTQKPTKAVQPDGEERVEEVEEAEEGLVVPEEVSHRILQIAAGLEDTESKGQAEAAAQLRETEMEYSKIAACTSAAAKEVATLKGLVRSINKLGMLRRVGDKGDFSELEAIVRGRALARITELEDLRRRKWRVKLRQLTKRRKLDLCRLYRLLETDEAATRAVNPSNHRLRWLATMKEDVLRAMACLGLHMMDDAVRTLQTINLCPTPALPAIPCPTSPIRMRVLSTSREVVAKPVPASRPPDEFQPSVARSSPIPKGGKLVGLSPSIFKRSSRVEDTVSLPTLIRGPRTRDRSLDAQICKNLVPTTANTPSVLNSVKCKATSHSLPKHLIPPPSVCTK